MRMSFKRVSSILVKSPNIERTLDMASLEAMLRCLKDAEALAYHGSMLTEAISIPATTMDITE